MWSYSHTLYNDIKVLTNVQGQELFEFTTAIEYDSFSIESQSLGFIQKIIETDSLKLTSDNDNNNEDFSIYFLDFNNKPAMRVTIIV